MPFYNSKPVFMILIPLLMLHRNSRTSFEFPNFSGPYQNKILTFQGDAIASASNGAIQLTKIVNHTAMPNSAGRASYALPVRLWDAKTGKIASFTSTFSFLVTTRGGDGISFFIAPFKSRILDGSSGGYLGLFSPHSALDSSKNKIVAVEFDTFSNRWDPAYAHVGIDVNSIASVATESWLIGNNDVYANTTVFATVTYDPLAHVLGVVARYRGSVLNGSVITLSLSHVVDLKKVLPEWVSVGFSGATGEFVEVNNVLSWSFSSGFY